MGQTESESYQPTSPTTPTGLTEPKKRTSRLDAYLTLQLAQNEYIYLAKEDFWPKWNCADPGPRSLIDLTFLTITDFHFIRKIWEEKAYTNRNSIDMNSEECTEKEKYLTNNNDNLFLYIRACTLMEINISGYECAIDSLLEREKYLSIRQQFINLGIYNKSLSRRLSSRLIPKFMHEVKGDEENKWIWISNSMDNELDEEEYSLFYSTLSITNRYNELNQTRKLEALTMVKKWITEYSIERLDLSAYLRCSNEYGVNANVEYNFSKEELNLLLNEDLPELKVLEIRNFKGEEIERIGDLLPKLIIQRLNLKQNAYKLMGVESLSAGIGQNTSLKALNINLDRSTHDAGNILAKFSEGIMNNQSINYLRISYLKEKALNNEYIQTLAHASVLKSLILTTINLEESGKYLERFLTKNHSIEKLLIVNCNMGDEECLFIVKGVKLGNSIHYLDLDGNNIGDKGGEALAELVTMYPKLEYLKLENNPYGNKTIQKFSYYVSLSSMPIPQLHLQSPKLGSNNYHFDIFLMIYKQKINQVHSFLLEKKIKDYECIQILEEGRFGTTYLVRHETNFYAIKEVHGKEKDKNRFVEALKEVNSLKALNHRNIIEYIDAFIQDHNFYIIMPIPIGTLSKQLVLSKEKAFIRSDSSCLVKLLKYARELAEGISIIHSKNYPHLDLKPENIFLDEYSNILIGNLGIVVEKKEESLEGESKSFHHLTSVQESMSYIAPEIWEERKFTVEPDIFAFGVIVYQLLVGCCPFNPGLFGGDFELICKGEYDEKPLDNITCITHEVKIQLKDLIRGCLNIDMNKRLTAWDALGQINKIYGRETIWMNHEQNEFVITYNEDINLKTQNDEDRFGYYYTNGTKEWALIEKNRSKIIDYDIFSRTVNHPAFIQQGNEPKLESSGDIYFINIPNEQFGGVFYTEILVEGTSHPTPINILKWLMEIIHPIKYLHDNNIYHHNITTRNIIFDKNKHLVFGPSEFPFSSYYTEAGTKVFRNSVIHNKKYYQQLTEFPELTGKIIKEEIRGIFKFWFELCTGNPYFERENGIYNEYFVLIKERYGCKWRDIIYNALNEKLEYDNLQDLNKLLVEEWTLAISVIPETRSNLDEELNIEIERDVKAAVNLERNIEEGNLDNASIPHTEDVEDIGDKDVECVGDVEICLSHEKEEKETMNLKEERGIISNDEEKLSSAPPLPQNACCCRII